MYNTSLTSAIFSIPLLAVFPISQRKVTSRINVAPPMCAYTCCSSLRNLFLNDGYSWFIVDPVSGRVAKKNDEGSGVDAPLFSPRPDPDDGSPVVYYSENLFRCAAGRYSSHSSSFDPDPNAVVRDVPRSA